MKLEAIDPKHPSYICVCTIVRVKGTRLRLHFDGWSESYDFWTSAESPFIFHVGWCEKNGQKLHPPRSKRRAQPSVFSVLFSFRNNSSTRSFTNTVIGFQLKRDWERVSRPMSPHGPCFTGFQSFINQKRVNGRIVTSLSSVIVDSDSVLRIDIRKFV